MSARPFVEAAVKAGYAVTAIDAFADVQTAALAEKTLTVAYDGQGFCADQLLAALNSLDLSRFSGVSYGSGFEAQPELLAKIAAKLPLIGNSAETVAAVKNPALFFSMLQHLHIDCPRMLDVLPEASDEAWLIKFSGGSGGAHIADADIGTSLPHKHFYQQKIDGRPVSLLFLANGREIEVIGFNEQWLNPTADAPYRYGGAVSNAALPESAKAQLADAAEKLAQIFGLVGLNSLDAIIDAENGQVFVLEINPRLSATFELYASELFDGTELNLFERHIQLCLNRHDLSPSDKQPSRLQCQAHAVVYAAADIALSELPNWPGWVTDTPEAGQGSVLIPAAAPVCSVLASADDAEAAKKLVQARVELVQNLLQSLTRKNV